MTDFDLVVLGGGTGNLVAAEAVEAGLDVALVERGRLGGTCLNRGCNPSKKLIHRANVAETVREAEAVGVDATLNDVAFREIVDHVTDVITEEAESKAEEARETDGLTFYQATGRFVDERTVEVDAGGCSGDTGGDGEDGDGGDGGDDTERITGDRIVLAGGSRPRVPDSIAGTDEVDFLTSDEALGLRERPDRLVIVGGGYIAVELAHFFGQMGTEVVVVGHGDVLVDREDRDIAERVTEVYEQDHELHLGFEVTALAEAAGETVVTAESEDGEEIRVRGDEALLAVGRRPNSDTWNVDAAGIETDEKGFVETNEYLETSVDGVWAIGDIAGNYMFKHSGDKEAECVVENAVRGNRTAVEYPGMAHAVFGSPQVGSLGRTESELDDGTDYEVGTFAYDRTALGEAMATDGGFAKAIIGPDDEVLGFHVVGPHASMLVHEVSTAVAVGGRARDIAETIHVHPALSEVVQGAFRDVHDVAASGL
ncbi:dihydrolipoyl dehydrogenase [Halorarum halophilum]|uniref:Dihydrolipoyl dehydrogenase n=1 Tax=Halorarum halophilum TaxID=2743090 RepID=A0A7D5GF61_9EURY|nr:dihydrolipoyl dehydrogenase [Halobaculum halophilum]QLG27988.1 dihydrolipoyl dehydrogenase [Halobaculum halophilum]